MGLFSVAVALYAVLQPSMGWTSIPTPHRATCQIWFRPLMTLKSNTETTSSSTTRLKDEFLYPKVGDVVAYEKESVSKVRVGEIRGFQRTSSNEEEEWFADVCPLTEIGRGQFQRVKGTILNLQGRRPSVFVPVVKLSPLKAFYVRSTNAFRVLYKGGNENGDGDMLKRGVYILDDFEFPQPLKALENSDHTLEVFMAHAKTSYASEYHFTVNKEFGNLKGRLVKDSLMFGIFGTLAAFSLGGLHNGAAYALGGICASVYLALLGEDTDNTLAGGMYSWKSLPLLLVGKTRHAIPCALTAFLAARNMHQHPETIWMLHLVPKEEFVYAMGGFLLSYRFPVLYRELISKGIFIHNIGAEFFPGSIAKLVQMFRGREKDKRRTLIKAAAAPEKDDRLVSPIVKSRQLQIGENSTLQLCDSWL